MIPVETTDSVLLENYVLVSGMDDFGWDEGDWEPDDWTDCENCGGPPPPLFNLPPPPRPPALPDEFGILQDFDDLYADCEYQWTCPAYHGAREDPKPSTEQFPIAVIIVTAATLVTVILVAAIIIFKVKRSGRSSKNCNQLGGAHIYDDLPTVNTRVRNHLNAQFKPISRDPGHGLPMGLHLYTPEPHSRPESEAEHLYQSISSGSETCSYSTGDAALPSTSHRPSPLSHSYSEARMAPSTLNTYCQAQPSLLPHNRLCFEAHSILNTGNAPYFTSSLMSGRDASNSPPCLSPCHSTNHMHQMKECHSIRHIPCQALHQLAAVTHCHTTRHTSYHSPQHTPCHTPQHTPCHSPQHAEIQSTCSSTKYEDPSYFSIPSGVVKSPSSTESSVYYVSGCNNTTNGRPITPQERGLPPLPSRSDRYRNYFSTDRNIRNAPGRPSSPPYVPPRIEPDLIARRLHPDVLGQSDKSTNVNRNIQNSLLSHNPQGLPPSYGADSSLPLSCERALPLSYGADSSLPQTCDRDSTLSSPNTRNNVVCTPSGVGIDRKNPRIEEEPLYENMP